MCQISKEEKQRRLGAKLREYLLGLVVLFVFITFLIILFVWDGSWLQDAAHEFFHPWWKFVIGAAVVIILEAYPVYLLVRRCHELKVELDDQKYLLSKTSKELTDTQKKLKKFQELTNGAIPEFEQIERERDDLRNQVNFLEQRNRELRDGLYESRSAIQSSTESLLSLLDEVSAQDDDLDSAELPIEEESITEPSEPRNSDSDIDAVLDIFSRKSN